jgi:hypothetical protein
LRGLGSWKAALITALAFILPLPWPVPSTAATKTPPAPRGSEARPQGSKSPEDFDLDALLASLAEKSKVYESVALRFVCLEQSHSSEDRGDGRRYDYMYVEAEAQRYRPYRQKHSENNNATPSTQEVDVDTEFPDSYSWTLMFVPNRQHLFKFKYEGDEYYSLRRANVITFTAPLPYTTGRTIYEWSGKVWIDAENLNFLKVEAQPANQEDRLKETLKAYRQSTRFLNMNLGHRPVGARYEITFLNDYQKLSLPDQAEFRRFVLDLDGDAELTGFQTQKYSNYQFFGVQVNDKFLQK